MTIRGGFMNRLQSQEARFRFSDLNHQALKVLWRYVRPHRGQLALAVLAMLTVTATLLLVGGSRGNDSSKLRRTVNQGTP